VRSCTVDQTVRRYASCTPLELRSVSIFAICMARCLVYRKQSTCEFNSSVSNASPFERRSSFVIAESIESRTFCSEVGNKVSLSRKEGSVCAKDSNRCFSCLDVLAISCTRPETSFLTPFTTKILSTSASVRPTCRGYCSMS